MHNEATQRAHWLVRVSKLTDEMEPLPISPAEGLAMMWPLALDAWAIKMAAEGRQDDAQSRLQRHVVRLVRTQS